MWNKVSKECDCEDAFDSTGHELSCFEPIFSRFNTKEYLGNCCFFNSHAKGLKHEGESLSLDANCSS